VPARFGPARDRTKRPMDSMKHLLRHHLPLLAPLGIVALCLGAGPIRAADMTLAWDANTETNLGGYKVYYGSASRAYGAPIDVGKVTTYTVTGLGTGTYYFAVTAYDTSGNESGYSNEVSNAAADGTPPTISGISVSGIGLSAATISWVTNEPSFSQVEYGTSPSYGSTTAWSSLLSSRPVQPLSGLTANTSYHFRVKSRDAAGNTATSADWTFTTASSPPPTDSAPQISAVEVTALGQMSATVAWTTDKAADSQVEYGRTEDYGLVTSLDTARVTAHSVRLQDLTAGTLYHLRVKSRDAADNLSVSTDYTFVTTDVPAPGGTAPVITAVAIENLLPRAATITWRTDIPADSQLEYGTSMAYGTTTVAILDLVTEHRYTVAGLVPETEYHFRVKSRSDSGIAAVSADQTFKTPPDGLTIDPTTALFPGAGGQGTVQVTAPAAMAWTATSASGWLQVLSGLSGAGNGSVKYGVAANNTGETRTGTLSIGGRTLAITQEPLTDTDPRVTVAMEKQSYVAGETIAASSFRLENPGSKNRSVELKSWLSVPGVAYFSVMNYGWDSSWVLPVGYDFDFGRIPASPVGAESPSGLYEFNTRLIDPVTGARMSEALNSVEVRTDTAAREVSAKTAGPAALTGYWKLNGDMLDSSPNENHGQIVSTRSIQSDGFPGDAGDMGLALSCEGGDYGEIPSSPSLCATSSLTLEARVRLNSLPSGEAPVVTKWGDTPASREYRLLVRSDGRLEARFSGLAGETDIVSAGALVAGVWTHVAAVLDMEGQETRLYIDGTLDSALKTSIVLDRGSAEPLYLGYGESDAASGIVLDGDLDEVRIWNVARTSEEILEAMDREDPASPALDIRLEKKSYSEGEVVKTSRLELRNPGIDKRWVELKVWFDLPGTAPVSVLNLGADGSFSLEPKFELSLGPLELMPVTSTTVKGNYGFHSRALDPVTGKQLSERMNPFEIR